MHRIDPRCKSYTAHAYEPQMSADYVTVNP